MTTPIGASSAAAQTSTLDAAASAKQSAELRNNFMTLLLTQLQNQDPLKPLENHEMTSQLAQINTVSGIEELNQTLQGLTEQMDANQALQASALIGQGVMVEGNRVLLEHDDEGAPHATPFGLELDEPAENVVATITNASGQVVNRYELGSVKAGVESFRWDGTTSEGETVSPGAYQVRLEALDADGEPLAVTPLHYAMVNSVTPRGDDGQVRLDLGAIYGQVGLDDIKQIL
ncbi:flagellar hook assembly protein FlgD [Billgrantia azerbaijanica]|nr:flagellar hook assembly protein FlgD [Halomonas azerbaijanica]